MALNRFDAEAKATCPVFKIFKLQRVYGIKFVYLLPRRLLLDIILQFLCALALLCFVLGYKYSICALRHLPTLLSSCSELGMGNTMMLRRTKSLLAVLLVVVDDPGSLFKGSKSIHDGELS